MDHQSTESLLEKLNVLSVNRINAQTKITEVWKALNLETKDNKFKKSIPQHNDGERESRSMTKGLLTINGHSVAARNCFINDSKKIWNKCPDELRNKKVAHPPKKLIKKFVKTLPL